MYARRSCRGARTDCKPYFLGFWPISICMSVHSPGAGSAGRFLSRRTGTSLVRMPNRTPVAGPRTRCCACGVCHGAAVADGLLFGLIEMSWAFAQLNDVRSGVREGTPVAAVDIGDIATVGQFTCDSMDVVAPAQNIAVSLTPVVSSPAVPGEGRSAPWHRSPSPRTSRRLWGSSTSSWVARPSNPLSNSASNNQGPATATPHDGRMPLWDTLRTPTHVHEATTSTARSGRQTRGRYNPRTARADACRVDGFRCYRK